MRKTWLSASREEGTGQHKLNQPHFVYEQGINVVFQCVAQSIAITTRCTLRIWEDSKLTQETATAPEYFVIQKSQTEKRNLKKNT